MKLVVLLLGVFILGLHGASAVGQAPPTTITLTDCVVENMPGKQKCGTFEVYENRATKTGRKISLNIVVYPATGEKREPDPVFYFAGGPGSAATDDALGFAPQFSKIREHRDLVFVDQRGTGKSHPLDCKLYNADDPQSYLGYFFPLEDVRKCRAQLESKADLTLYTTTIAMDDIDEVRAALGYERINLFGGSYGTRAALTYLKRYPQRVRTATLQGVAPTDQYMPADFPVVNERALQGIIAECAADQACSNAFPNLKAETNSVLAQLMKGPVEAEVKMSPSSAPIKVKLSRDLAAEAIRYMLYSPVPATRVPITLHLAAQGNFGPLAHAALRYRVNLVGTGSNGMYLSVTCAEDLPWIKKDEAERLAANTFLGAYRFRQQREACELWPRAKVEHGYSEPTKVDVPVLILTGQWDPVTPPSHGERTSKTLPNSLHIVVPQGAHGFGGLEGTDCIQGLITEFVARGTTKGMDTSCVKSIRRKGFVLKL